MKTKEIGDIENVFVPVAPLAVVAPPVPSTVVAPSVPLNAVGAPSGLLEAQYDRAQLADQPRLPWSWDYQGKLNTEYTPQVPDKWWSRSREALEALPPSKRRDFGHIGRIMETELGVLLSGEEACSACRGTGQECWVYPEKGAQQVSRPGDSCARCRVTARSGGCSLSKLKRRHRPPSPPVPHPLSAYKPFGSPSTEFWRQ